MRELRCRVGKHSYCGTVLSRILVAACRFNIPCSGLHSGFTGVYTLSCVARCSVCFQVLEKSQVLTDDVIDGCEDLRPRGRLTVLPPNFDPNEIGVSLGPQTPSSLSETAKTGDLAADTSQCTERGCLATDTVDAWCSNSCLEWSGLGPKRALYGSVGCCRFLQG